MDRDKTAFKSHCGLYRFIRMPFSLRNSLAFSSTKWISYLQLWNNNFVLVYLDDIVIYSKSPEKQMGHARRVLTLWNDADITSRLKMWKFFTETIAYTVHVIHQRHLKIASHMIGANSGIKPQTNLTELRSFLGSCNVFSRFDPNIARVATQLYQELRKDQPPTIGNSERWK